MAQMVRSDVVNIVDERCVRLALGRIEAELAKIRGILYSKRNQRKSVSLYAGPIEIGMHFIWEKDKPGAWAHVIVMDLREFPSREYMIRLANVADKDNPEGFWNDESRCREALTPCDERGVFS